ncbi:MAG: hypothetical protein RBR02_09300 [Desulfuromonadaceae bacterium]|nr:hypothetical protein [Desulfuromonadaceae bacterium]
MRFFLILFIFFNLNLIAEDGVDEQFTTSKNFIELYDKEKDIQHLEGMEYDVNKNLNLMKNMQLSLKSKTISIINTTIIKIELHPLYFTKIFLPKDANIINFQPSVPMRHINYKWNRAMIRPNPDLIGCNIDLTFEYKNKVYDVTIFADKYDVSRDNSRDNVLYTKVILAMDNPLSPAETIELYRSSYGELPKEKLTYFQHNDIVYKIEYSDFNNKDPENSPNVQVLYNSDVFSYKVTNGVKQNL